MKLKVNTKELKAALAKLASLPGSNSGLVWNSIVTLDADEFGGLRFCRTTVHALARITCLADIEEDGRAVVPYLALSNVMPNFEAQEITLSCKKGGSLIIRDGEDFSEVHSFPENEVIPAPPKLDGAQLSLSHEELIKTLKITSAASSTDISRPQYMGVCFRKVPGALSIFGVNGHRAHVSRLAALVSAIDPEPGTDRDFGILLPSAGVDCILKVFGGENSPCMLTLAKSGIQIDAGDICVRLPVSDHRSPFVEKLLNPAPEINLTVPREPLLKAIRGVAPASGDGGVKLSVQRGAIHISAESAPSNSFRKVACETDGEGEYFVESKYISSLLQCTELDRLHMWICAKGQQIYYREGERDFLIMLRAGQRKK
jgi:DNA polymerase III sliding clamp (beta) subunit (PCNA family)